MCGAAPLRRQSKACNWVVVSDDVRACVCVCLRTHMNIIQGNLCCCSGINTMLNNNVAGKWMCWRLIRKRMSGSPSECKIIHVRMCVCVYAHVGVVSDDQSCFCVECHPSASSLTLGSVLTCFPSFTHLMTASSPPTPCSRCKILIYKRG